MQSSPPTFMANDIPKTHRAALISTFDTDLILDLTRITPEPDSLTAGECLIKLEFAGVCHSDLTIRNGKGWATSAGVPMVGGHEGVGTVVAVGAHTRTNSIKVGDRVGMKWISQTCKECEMCLKGHEASCQLGLQRSHGFKIDGTFAEYAVSSLDYVTPIPAGLSSAAATPFLCAGLTVYKALKNSKTTVGNWVTITGSGGGLGHLAVQFAVAMGLQVVAIDTGDSKRALAMEHGAEQFVDFMTSDNIIEDVQKAADGQGPHAAIVLANDPMPFLQALMYLRPTGTLVAVGMPAEDALLSFPIPLIIGKSLTIVGSALGNRQDAIEALDLAARGKVKCIYEIRPLSEINKVFAEMQAGKLVGRVVLDVTV